MKDNLCDTCALENDFIPPICLPDGAEAGKVTECVRYKEGTAEDFSVPKKLSEVEI